MDSKSSPSFFCISAIKLLLIQDIHCIRCDQQFFICWDHYYFHFRSRSRNDCFFTANLSIYFVIKYETHEFHILTHFTTTFHLVLTYTTSKQDNIHTAPCSSISTDLFLNTVIVHLLCKDSFLIASRTSSQKFAHIA